MRWSVEGWRAATDRPRLAPAAAATHHQLQLLPPAHQPVDADAQQVHVVPGAHLRHALGRHRRDRGNRGTKSIEPLIPALGKATTVTSADKTRRKFGFVDARRLCQTYLSRSFRADARMLAWQRTSATPQQRRMNIGRRNRRKVGM